MALEMQRVQLQLKSDEAAQTQSLAEQVRAKDAELLRLQAELRSARHGTELLACLCACVGARILVLSRCEGPRRLGALLTRVFNCICFLFALASMTWSDLCMLSHLRVCVRARMWVHACQCEQQAAGCLGADAFLAEFAGRADQGGSLAARAQGRGAARAAGPALAPPSHPRTPAHAAAGRHTGRGCVCVCMRVCVYVCGRPCVRA